MNAMLSVDGTLIARQ